MNNYKSDELIKIMIEEPATTLKTGVDMPRLYIDIDGNKQLLVPCGDCVHHHISYGVDHIKHFCNVECDHGFTKELNPERMTKSSTYVPCSIMCEYKRKSYEKYLKYLEENGLKDSPKYLQIQSLIKKE